MTYNVTVITLVMLTSLLGGVHSLVFGQTSSNPITTHIEESEQKINDSLEESQQRIEHLDEGLPKITEVDVKWILFFTDLFALD